MSAYPLTPPAPVKPIAVSPAGEEPELDRSWYTGEGGTWVGDQNSPLLSFNGGKKVYTQNYGGWTYGPPSWSSDLEKAYNYYKTGYELTGNYFPQYTELSNRRTNYYNGQEFLSTFYGKVADYDSKKSAWDAASAAYIQEVQRYNSDVQTYSKNYTAYHEGQRLTQENARRVEKGYQEQMAKAKKDKLQVSTKSKKKVKAAGRSGLMIGNFAREGGATGGIGLKMPKV